MQKPLALALCSIALVAITFLQAQTTKTEVAFSGNHVAITDLGDKGSLLSNCSNGTVNVCRFDMNGKQLWTQSITYKKNFRPIFCESLNGEDFYVLMYWKSKPKGGTEGLTISRISTSDGKIETREHPEAAPGHALVAYATNTALYVVTSDKAFDEPGKGAYTASLVRFSRSDLSFTVCASEWALDGGRERHFWQCYKVEQNFIEGYRVAELNGKMIKVEIARFDTTGKKMFSKSTELELKNGFPSPANSNLPQYNSITAVISTIEISYAGSSAPSLVTSMGMCHLLYDEVTGEITLYGAVGPREYTAMSNKMNGYFIARLDKDFNLKSLSEFTNSTLIEGKAMGTVSNPVQRFFTGYLQPDNNLGFLMYALRSPCLFVHDYTTFEIKSSSVYSKDIYRTHSTFLPELDDLLWHDPQVKAEMGHFKGAHLVSTRKMQYLCLYVYDGSKSWYYTKPVK